MIKAVFFDLDGTLADTALDLGFALNEQRKLHGLPPIDQAVIRPHASHGARGLLKIGFDVSPGDPQFDAMRNEFLDLYERHICTHTTIFPDVEETLSELTKRGIAWGIVTNKPARFTEPLLQQLGLTTNAGCIVSGDTCARAKPHPDSLIHACALIGATPDECIYVGDAKRDIEAAIAAGMKSVVAMWGYLGVEDAPADWGADVSINAPQDLITLLELPSPNFA